MATQSKGKMGQTKHTTDDLIDDAVASQQSWLENRRLFARSFFESLNVFAKPSPKKSDVVGKPAVKAQNTTNQKRVLRDHWFTVLCVLCVVFVTIWVLFHHVRSYEVVKVVNPEPVEVVNESVVTNPSFGDVHIGDDGLAISGKWRPNTGVSVFMNDKLIATIMTDDNGNFSYNTPNLSNPGNYTFYLMDANSQIKSEKNIFIYVSEPGVTHSELIFPKHKLKVNVQTIE